VGPYLEFTTNYYTDTSNAHVQQVEAGKMSATRYVEWALEMVTEERDRADACFDSHAAKNVVFHVRDAAGSKQGHKIVQKGELTAHRSPGGTTTHDTHSPG
jgi:predicted Mrr-cat superfamily restriction endonuclease